MKDSMRGKSDINTYLKKIESLESEYRASRKRVKQIKESIRDTKEELKHVSEAQTVLETVASLVQRNWYLQLGSIVSRCLKAVFGEDAYEFKLVFKQLANRTEVEFLLQRDQQDFDPMGSTGGGVVDVAAFALRVAAQMLSVQGERCLLVLDEPFRFVSATYRPSVRLLLEKLTEEFSVQIIMVTHMEELETGKVVKI